jgi:transposase
MTQTEIVNHFNCSKITIYRLLVRVRSTDTTSDRRRSGRPRETTLRQDRHFTLIHLRNRSATAVDTARPTPGIRNNIISYQTVRNRLRQSGFRSYRPLKDMELKRLSN